MQRKILKPQWMLSVLSVALLAACGGGEMGTFSPNDPRNGPDSQAKNRNTGPKAVDRKEPTINKFLTSMQGEDAIGQQNSPTVTSIDNNDNKKIDPSDRISFNQPGLVSAIVGASKASELGYVDPDSKGNNNSNNNSKGNNSSSPSSTFDRVLMQDVNNRWHEVRAQGTVDQKTPNGFANYDAGVNKIHYKRINGQLTDYGGTIDRRFNGLLLFTTTTGDRKVNTNDYLSAFFRNPAAAGWSYQTFGYFFGNANNGFLDKTRDAFVGYQSIGRPTKGSEMPKSGSADYNGITHGYYNGNQVTALNKIHADFGKRKLNYETVGTAQLHTFEGERRTSHVIEDKPAYNLSGTATWGGNSGDFAGDIRTAEGLTGKMQGRFYGPAAEEIGGVFGLQGVATDGSAVQYVGGFGGQR